MTFPELERRVLHAALVGHVVEDFDDMLALAAVYRELDAQGLVDVEWWAGDQMPVVVALTAAGRTLVANS